MEREIRIAVVKCMHIFTSIETNRENEMRRVGASKAHHNIFPVISSWPLDTRWLRTEKKNILIH